MKQTLHPPEKLEGRHRFGGRLGDVLMLRKDIVHPRSMPNGKTVFVGLQHVESNTGHRLGAETVEMSQLTGRKPRFYKGDIVYGYLRPYLNKVWVAEFDGLCSVDQYVYSVNASLADTEYVAAFMRSPVYLRTAPVEETPGQLPRIRTEEVADVAICLPPLGEQRKIAARLKEELAEVARARAAVEAQLKAAQLLPTAILCDVFESSEARSWPRRNLAEVCTIDAIQVDPTLPEYKVLPHVNGENIESGSQRLTNVQTAEQDGMTSGKYLFESGNVLYSKLRPYLRKVAVAPFRGLCSADMYPIRVSPESLDADFAAWLLLSDEFTKFAVGESQRSRMPKLNREQLFSWKAPIPELSRQRDLAQRIGCEMTAITKLHVSLKDRLLAISALPGSILNAAFNLGMKQGS